MQRLTLAAVVLLGIIGMSCDSTPTSPSTTTVAGKWGGTTCAPSLTASCAFQMTISQEGPVLTGTWGKTTTHGTLTGTISGSTVSLVLAGEFAPFTLTLTVSGNQMSGAYTDQSTISLARQTV